MQRNSKLMSLQLHCFVVILLAARLGKAQLDQVCRHPLGMQDKRIPDYYLKATSSHAESTGPRYARLMRDEGDGAWCPSGVVQPGTEKEYITIQLRYRSYVTQLATQGRYAHGVGKEYTTNYKVNYSRDGKDFFSWSSSRGVKLFQGNTRQVNNVEYRSLNPGIAGAKYIRIIPITKAATSVCLRLELYGCVWNSGLISYDIPTPDDYTSSPGPPFPTSMYSDDTYDGKKTSSYFTRGLGQLTDGIFGADDVTITKSRYHTSAVGYDYVGWSDLGRSKRQVIINFQFDEVKNFTSMKIHCSLNPAAGASLFSSMIVSSSLDGRSFVEATDSSRLSFNGQVSQNGILSRFIAVSLHHLIARAIKLTFELGDGRLLLSEVEFHNSFLAPDVLTRYSVKYAVVEEVEDQNGAASITKTPAPKKEGTNIGLIVGILVGIIVLLAVIVIALYWRQRKLRKTLVPPSYSYRASSSRSDHLVTLTPRLPSDSSGVAMETKQPMPVYHEIGSTVIPPDGLYLEPNDVVRRPPPPPYQSDDDVSGSTSKGTVRVKLPSEDGSSEHGESSSASHYAETDIFLSQHGSQPLQGVSGNNIYSVPWSSPKREQRKRKGKKARTLPALHGTTRSCTDSMIEEKNALLSSLNFVASDLPPEFPRDRLEFVEKLGEGQFGEVHLCKADASIRDLNDDDFILSCPSGDTMLVAVKVLRKDASDNAKEDFLKEVRVMGKLQDPNIVRLLAVCTNDEPFAMVTEYMEHGDLNQYLLTFDDEIKPVPGKNVIGNESIISMAAQIASGMEYLSSLNFVHRDLATRNCLVGADFSIRIGDFGMSRNMYQSDYYRIQGRAVLPIRWMSWECVLMGKFSSASDVWAFGVTLWEMFSLCKYQPHAAMNNQQVIENLHNIFRKTGEEVYLPRPKRCPASMFNMIRQCWKRAPEDRPTFHQLYTYLLERQQTAKPSPKPQKPQVKPPIPRTRIRLSP